MMLTINRIYPQTKDFTNIELLYVLVFSSYDILITNLLHCFFLEYPYNVELPSILHKYEFDNDPDMARQKYYADDKDDIDYGRGELDRCD